MQVNLLCNYCIESIRSHGEPVYKGELKYDYEESVLENVKCEHCNEHDDLYECKL